MIDDSYAFSQIKRASFPPQLYNSVISKSASYLFYILSFG